MIVIRKDAIRFAELRQLKIFYLHFDTDSTATVCTLDRKYCVFEDIRYSLLREANIFKSIP